MIEGAGAVVTYAFVGGEHQFTFATSATPFPPLSVTNADLQPAAGAVGSGNVGSSGEVVHSNHVHPRSTAGDARDGLDIVTASIATAATFASAVLSFRPRFVVAFAKAPGIDSSVGMGSGPGTQGYVIMSGADAAVSGSIMGNTTGSENMAVTGAFARGSSVTFSRTGAGGNVFKIVYAVLGDNADL